MGFNSKVNEDALVACGRRCCICHKYCCTKIELHHIKQKADGGDDGFDNCIPLCFDCHAEVNAYNPKHPKGKKFKELELKRHRDLWYEKVKNCKYDLVSNEKHNKLDVKVYEIIKELLFKSGTFIFLKELSFVGYSFKDSDMDTLRRFQLMCENDPEFEFIDIDLESFRMKLYEYISNFLWLVATNTWCSKNREGYKVMDQHLKDYNPEKFYKIIDEFKQCIVDIVEVSEEFVKLGRRKLGI